MLQALFKLLYMYKHLILHQSYAVGKILITIYIWGNWNLER